MDDIRRAKKLLESKGYLVEKKLFNIDESESLTLEEFEEKHADDYGWEYDSLEEALEDYIDEDRLDESNDRHRVYEPGDIIMTTAFYSPSSRQVVKNKPHRILIVTSAEKEDGVTHYRGFELSSQVQKSNKKGGYRNSLYIKNYSTILERGAKSDKEAMIIVNDLVKFSSRDLSTSGSYKGHASSEFIDFVQQAYNNYKSGKDNSQMYWEK